MKIKEIFSKKLLVEGNDDQHVVWALCQKFGVTENFDVIDSEGYTKLLDTFPVRLKQPDIKAIGLVLDADSSLNSRWNNVRSALISKNYDAPESLPTEGLILENESGIKVGVWIMPNNNIAGMLEDFVSFLIPDDDKLKPKVDTFLNELESSSLAKYKSIHRAKAQIHTWLALQEDPGIPMGSAISRNYLSKTEAECQAFISWLNRLFS